MLPVYQGYNTLCSQKTRPCGTLYKANKKGPELESCDTPHVIGAKGE